MSQPFWKSGLISVRFVCRSKPRGFFIRANRAEVAMFCLLTRLRPLLLQHFCTLRKNSLLALFRVIHFGLGQKLHKKATLFHYFWRNISHFDYPKDTVMSHVAHNEVHSLGERVSMPLSSCYFHHCFMQSKHIFYRFLAIYEGRILT